VVLDVAFTSVSSVGCQILTAEATDAYKSFQQPPSVKSVAYSASAGAD
jgi:hypothetical protein